MRRVLFGALAVAVSFGFASTAMASHLTPLKAKKMKGEFVTAYADCTAPTTVTDPPGLTLPACSPVRGDSVCGFGPKGGGKFGAASSALGDITVKATIKGMDAACIGETLVVTATVNATADDCAGGSSCTIQTALLNDFPTGSCVVDAAGVCKINTTTNTFAGSTIIELGKRLNLEIRGIEVHRGSAAGPHTLSAGILVP